MGMEKLKWVNSAKVNVNILFCNYSFGGQFVISSRKVYQTGDYTGAQGSCKTLPSFTLATSMFVS